MNAEKLIVREINIHSFLNHQNIIKLYGFFHDDQNIYLILEYANQGELYQELLNQPDRRFSLDQSWKILKDLIKAFLYLQEK